MVIVKALVPLRLAMVLVGVLFSSALLADDSERHDKTWWRAVISDDFQRPS